MSPPSPSRFPAAVFATVLFLFAAPSAALAQRAPDGVSTGAETAAGTPWYVQSVTAALLTLVIGGLLIAVAPDSTRRQTDRALETPGAAFVYGFGTVIGVIGLSFVLAITVVGIVVAVPLLLGFVLAALVAGEYGYLAVGRLVTDDWLPALGVATVVSAAVGAVPVFGTLAGFVISSIGLGTVAMGFLDRRGSRP